MAYTYGGNKVKSINPNLASLFSNLQVDAGRNSLTGVLGNRMQSHDATATPVYSPITNGSAAGITLTVPQNAAQFYIYVASTDTAIVGEDSTFTYGMFVPTATVVGPIDVANQQFIYITPSSGTNTIYFYFSTI